MVTKTIKGIRFSKIEEEYIRQNFGKIPNAELAKELHRSVGAIIQKAHRMGICGTYKQQKNEQ